MDIVVDTYKLGQYAQRLSAVNRRITKLDDRLCSLYWKVGLQGLFDLMQAEAVTGYSWRLRRCQDYLTCTAADFEGVEKKLNGTDPLSFKPLSAIIKEAIFNVGAAIKKGAEKIKSVAEKALIAAIKNYQDHGAVFKIVQCGKAVLTAAKGIGKIIGAVAAIGGTGGMSTPVAILAIISGMNDVTNSAADITRTIVGDYDNIGQNLLKDTLAKNGKEFGKAIGHEKAGEFVGNAVYYGIDIVTSLEALDLSWDKIKQSDPTKFDKMAGELKELGHLDLSKMLTTDLETLRYQAKLAGYTFEETTNFISNAGTLMEVGGNAVDFAKGLNDVYTAYDKDFVNPSVEFIDKVSAVKDSAKGVIDITSWDYGKMFSEAKKIDSVFVFKKAPKFLNSDISFSREFKTFADDIKAFGETVESTVNGGQKLFGLGE